MERPTDELNFLRHIVEPIADDSENQIVWSIRRLLEYVDELESIGLQFTEEVLKYLDDMERTVPDLEFKFKKCDTCMGIGMITTYSSNWKGVSSSSDKCGTCKGLGRIYGTSD